VNCVYLDCFDSDSPGCRGDNDRKDALAVAMHLRLSFQVLDFRKEYQTAVIDYFKKEYLAGRTPNPDVVCNRDIKFGLFLDWAIKHHYEYIATGHYAKKVEKADNLLLHIPADLHKDQTYFLWAVPGEKFKKVLFPLGDLLKTEVREIALKIGLPVAKKKDSTGICFVGEVRVEDFLKKLGVREKEGEVVDSSYQVIGSHRGVWFYTIGQRHGFEIFNFQFSNSKQDDRPPFYVIEKDIKKNRLVVGFGAETYRDQFVVSDTNWLISNFKFQISNLPHVYVRLRHGGELIPCEINALTHQRINVLLRSAQRGIAPGQSAVFYNQEGTVLGGGIIQ
ncbi:MAG: tRNA 2-thiouridine(34) synthase MnmA, partial [Nitrospirota bacterium]